MRKTLRIRALSTFFIMATVLFVVLTYSTPAFAQSLTTGAISGTVTDQTNAVMPGATVTVINTGSGDTRTGTTNTTGSYLITLLVPGDYRLKVSAKGFKNEEQGPITVTVSQTAAVNITMEVGTATQTVEVTANAQLIQTENPNTTTTVSTSMIDALPNAGNDLTYVAQIAPGAIMNTTGGYGNMEFNGLPATSTNFTVDGMDANDPFLNLNNSGATNLQLGLNAVQEVSVNTLSFSVDQGRSGAAQVNYITKPGTNNWHGNAFETWNGRSMNAVDWFINAQPGAPATRTFSNVNQFGGSIGGPIIHNKLFVFGDVEGIQISLPATKTEDYPSQAYESLVIASIPTGGYDPVHEVTYAPPPNAGVAVAAYQKELALYGTPTGGVPISTSDCPLGNNPDGSPAQPWAPTSKASSVHGDGCRLVRTFGISNNTHDLFIKTRVDHDINANNRVWYSFDWERGVQATYTDAVNPVFNAFSTQPQDGASISFTHTFSPSAVNEFNPGFYWYSAIFEPNSFSKALAASPYEFTGASMTPIYGDARDWPQGRNVLDWQLIDNFTLSRHTHTLKFGGNLRRSLVSDHDPGTYTTPYLNMGDMAQYAYDITGSLGELGFAPNAVEPIGIVAMDLYAQDTWKWKSNVTVNYGIRATWNSDPKSQDAHFARYAGSFDSISHDPNQPLNAIIKPTNSLLFPSTQLLAWQPRASVAWSVKPSTVLRLGGGAFSDIFPASIADNMLSNFPNKNVFDAGWAKSGQPVTANYAVPGSGNGILGDPSNDALSNIAFANTNLNAGFKNGVVSCVAANAPSNCLPSAGYYAVPDGTFKYPMFFEWRATVEQQFGSNWRLSVGYVGTHASHMPYTEAANGFQTACPGCFAPYLYDPTYNGPDGRFGGVTQLLQGANSSYNALQTSLEKRLSHGLTFRANYTWSHCIDTSSNEGAVTGGFDGQAQESPNPGQLYTFKGNCDYDVRHEFNGSWVYQLPSPMHNRFLKQVLGGWQYSGDIFLHTGFPFSVYSAGYGANGNGVYNASGANGGTGFAVPTGASAYDKWQKLPTQSPGVAEIQWLNPSAFESLVDPSTGSCTAGETFANGSAVTANDNAQTCQYGGGARNNVFSPGLIWTDMFISKNFNITERLKLRIDGQFYNAFNHMNPGFPGTGAGITQSPSSLADAFVITGAVNPPTGLLGSGLGGDNSVRMIAFHARLEF